MVKVKVESNLFEALFEDQCEISVGKRTSEISAYLKEGIIETRVLQPGKSFFNFGSSHTST